MTICQAIEKLDQLKPNTLQDEEKVAWLSEVDGRIHREIFLTHEDNPAGCVFVPYDCCDDMHKQLLAREPYADLYHYYLSAMIDLATRDTESYTDNMILYNKGYREFEDHWTRTHMPKHQVTQFMF